jgi:hypothetical protein
VANEFPMGYHVSDAIFFTNFTTPTLCGHIVFMLKPNWMILRSMCVQSNGLHFIFKPQMQRRYIERELNGWDTKCLIINQFTLYTFLCTKVYISKYTNVVHGLKSNSTLSQIFNKQDKWLALLVENILLKESTNVKTKKKNNMGFKITTKSSMITLSFNYNIFLFCEVNAIAKPHSFSFFLFGL